MTCVCVYMAVYIFFLQHVETLYSVQINHHPKQIYLEQYLSNEVGLINC